ncbi:MAG: 50S ribosomal protein L18 [Bacteroidota bacterium]|jgi:large subunit ribosomal protein L18|nr:50S ribosomal protein L18 [Bacteroidales bacterium]MDI9575488.1 50S ribosomal protein L18 [Bacteroidota bacterium]HHW60230.1 50S ribosomal protein L18 [Bacteroidales bacterium]
MEPKIKNKKEARRKRIKMRIRKKIRGTTDKPRLCVFRSDKEIYAQIIDDSQNITIMAVSSLCKELKDLKMTKTDKAREVGKLIAQKALDADIKTVIFDRNGYLYHGRVKALAEGAREKGLKF